MKSLGCLVSLMFWLLMATAAKLLDNHASEKQSCDLWGCIQVNITTTTILNAYFYWISWIHCSYVNIVLFHICSFEPWHVGPSSGWSRQGVLPVSLHAGDAVKIQTQPQQATIPPNHINKGKGCVKDNINYWYFTVTIRPEKTSSSVQ